MKTQSLLSALTSFLAALLLACGPDPAGNLDPASTAAPAQPAAAAPAPEPQALAQDPVIPAPLPAWLPGTYARKARVDLDVTAVGDAKTLSVAAGPNSIATLNGRGWDVVAATTDCGAP